MSINDGNSTLRHFGKVAKESHASQGPEIQQNFSETSYVLIKKSLVYVLECVWAAWESTCAPTLQTDDLGPPMRNRVSALGYEPRFKAPKESTPAGPHCIPPTCGGATRTCSSRMPCTRHVATLRTRARYTPEYVRATLRLHATSQH